MSMPVLRPYGPGGEAVTTEAGAISPFAPVTLSGDAEPRPAPPPGQVLHSPFAEAASAVGASDLGAEATGALLAELDDARFAEALEMLEDDVAARHLRSIGTWSSESAAPVLATADTAQWMAELAEEADRMLGALEAHFGDRLADSVQASEIDAVAGYREADGFTNPLTSQQLFLGGLLDKAKKLAKGVGKLARKGLAFAGKLALGPLFGILRKLVRPLLRKVLDSAIGRLPESLRPLATQLAAKLRGSGELSTEDTFAEEFDRELATAVTSPGETGQPAGDPEFTGDDPGPGHDLDDARARLSRELATADPGVPPTEQLEQFIPVVMAALPLIRTGIGIIGRDKIVDAIAGPLSQLISGMVGADAAQLLSRHIAGAGLGLLGLEAGGDGTLGGEALVAAAEDTVRQVMTLPPESLGHELLVETEVQDAFAEAAARHLPAAVLRAELVGPEHGVWVMMPRATRPCFRYKKYGRVIPVRLTRPMARAVVLAGGDTLERRLLESGVQAWPVEGEVELYELLAGGRPGHIAAYESADGANAAEFEELTQTAATLLTGNPRLAGPHRHGHHRRAGGRYFRFRRQGRPLHRGYRQGFVVGFDLTAPQPVLRVNLLIGERDSHELAAQLQRRQLVQVVSTVRRLLDDAALQAMTTRLERLLTKHGITAPAGAGRQLAQRLADGMLRTVSEQLPASAQTLAQAAQDPAPGATLTFTFSFADRAAVAAGTPAGDPAVTIRPGLHRD
ncbi:hypothetical protein Amsp01_091140 [Amycolatopsis sp. NBRC 101858]|uniref:hypothetical protein n=1 Tax=Amycolatopsis sp. NBRC 101858 TaxID=3032200 RepID=UPI0024A2BAD4|nr:hypothetical protein [Amycolatopsis sp. NBRC 101858]GLY43091.1 hypothetical protein Amsp01_091140 [Amycolatopsis sp. NBRC 101858]